MKSITIDYDVLLIILSALSALIAARDIILRKDKKWYKRISLAGWTLILLSAGIGLITWQKIQSDNAEKDHQANQANRIREADKRDILKNVDSALEKYGLRIEKTKSKSVIIIDTSKNILLILDVSVFANEINPTVRVSNNLDTLHYAITIECINTGIAYNLKDRFLFFRIKGGIFSYASGFTKRLIGENEKIYGHKGLMLSGDFLIKDLFSKKSETIDSLYIFLKVSYSNKPNNYKPKGIFRTFYYLTVKQPFTSSKDVSQLKMVQSKEYQIIKKEFSSKGYW